MLDTEHVTKFDRAIVWIALAMLGSGIISSSVGNPFAPVEPLAAQRRC